MTGWQTTTRDERRHDAATRLDDSFTRFKAYNYSAREVGRFLLATLHRRNPRSTVTPIPPERSAKRRGRSLRNCFAMQGDR